MIFIGDIERRTAADAQIDRVADPAPPAVPLNQDAPALMPGASSVTTATLASSSISEGWTALGLAFAFAMLVVLVLLAIREW